MHHLTHPQPIGVSHEEVCSYQFEVPPCANDKPLAAAGMDFQPPTAGGLTMKTTFGFAAWLAPLGRLMLAFMFLHAGWGKLQAPQMTADFMSAMGFPGWIWLVSAIGYFELAAGLLLVLGWWSRVAALGLAVFTVVATLAFHGYWSMPPEMQLIQQLLFLKNMAVTGALLLFVVVGPGPLSFDYSKKQALQPKNA